MTEYERPLVSIIVFDTEAILDEGGDSSGFGSGKPDEGVEDW